MAADKEIMKAIERLRLDRPGLVYRAAATERPDGDTLGYQIRDALETLAATFREEAELWAKSGAKGWKGSEADLYVIAGAIDTVAAKLDNAGGGAALSVSEPVTLPRQFADTSHERLDDFVASAVAAGKGTLRPLLSEPVVPPTPEQVTAGIEAIREKISNGEIYHKEPMDVAAYLKGDIDTLPGLREALVPGSVRPYCSDCDHDTHRCGGCGEPLPHGEYACPSCKISYAESPCCEHMLSPDEDPASWCDCRSDDDMAAGHAGPCKRQAHLRLHHNTPAEKMPTTWESDTMTADGLRKPGLAPTLGQPGDMGTGYSHTYVPPGGRKVTFAELLTPVPAASLPPHLSHSQGNTIGDCGAKYRLQRVEQLPQIPQWANIGGTAFHAAVEAIERTMVNAEQAGRPITLDGYNVDLGWKEHFEQTIAAVAATTTVPISVWRAARKGAEGEQWWRVNGPQMLRRYLDVRPERSPITIDSSGTPAIEWEVTADVPTNYGPVPFVAKLDSVKLSADGTAIVIEDYKTPYERPTDTTQLGDYAWALIVSGANLHGTTKILGTYFDARRGEWTEPVDLLQAHPFEAFQYRVTTAHAQKRALTTGPTPARPSSYCGGCAVRYACPVMAAKS